MRLALPLLLVLLLAACQPQVGSERWCRAMADTPKGDWSLNEARDYARHCVLPKDADD